MNLSEIIKRNNWLSVRLTLLSLYPDQEHNIEAYENIYQQLHDILPVQTQMLLVISEYTSDESPDETYVDVSGTKLHTPVDNLTNSYALEFTPWREWLGMQIDETTKRLFNELEIISHCLYEMTFVGYSETEIHDQFSMIKHTVDEIKNFSEEEKKLHLKSFDDFLKDLEVE